MLLPSHGANPEALLKALKINTEESYIDFSVNTNPFGPPKVILHEWEEYKRFVSLYPAPTSTKLKEKIAAFNDVQADEILVGNGAAELIFLLASHFQGKKVLIVEPTFSEYRDACRSFDCIVDEVVLTNQDDWQLNMEKIIQKLRTNEYSALFICHPNNPTGCTYNMETLITVIREADHFGVTVIIDEAFYDFCTSQVTVTPILRDFNNLVVLRSLTKMFSIAGIRLGYAMMNGELAQTLLKKQYPWNVNGIAQAIGLKLFQEQQFVQDTAKKIESERKRIFPILASIGYEVSNSKVNYYLLKEMDKDGDTLPLIKYLIHHGIIPRHTYNFIGLEGKYIRLTIKDKEQNDKLITVLKGWKE